MEDVDIRYLPISKTNGDTITDGRNSFFIHQCFNPFPKEIIAKCIAVCLVPGIFFSTETIKAIFYKSPFKTVCIM